MEPGTASPVAQVVFTILLTLLFGAILLLLIRTTLMMSLLWIMPVARMLSFVPGIRRWIERKTAPRVDDAIPARAADNS